MKEKIEFRIDPTLGRRLWIEDQTGMGLERFPIAQITGRTRRQLRDQPGRHLQKIGTESLQHGGEGGALLLFRDVLAQDGGERV